jgi:phosphoribosylformylglycinamidine synthase II
MTHIPCHLRTIVLAPTHNLVSASGTSVSVQASCLQPRSKRCYNDIVSRLQFLRSDHLLGHFTPLVYNTKGTQKRPIDPTVRNRNVTTYQIEVWAVSEQHDTHAHRLAHEISHLPTRHLSTLAHLPHDAPPFFCRTAQLYLLTGNLTPTQLSQLNQQLLTDVVIQQATITPPPTTAGTGHSPIPTAGTGHSPIPTVGTGLASIPTVGTGLAPVRASEGHIVDVFFHAGVTDTLAESVLIGAHMLGIDNLEHVETGRRYLLDHRLTEDEGHTIAQALLHNPVIQTYTLVPAQTRRDNPSLSSTTPHADADRSNDSSRSSVTPHADVTPHTRTIPISLMNNEQLLELSKTGLLSLNLAEMQAIQQHYQTQGREPTDVELETLAQTWSEHCSHKTFKATIHYHELDQQGHTIQTETIPGLLKRYIMRATEQVKPAWLVSAFSDNAGIIRLTNTHDIAFKVETHNHPSAIEPFGGANTGVGGVIRDILGVSAQPIACTDILCFGPQDTSADELPPGVLSPQRIANGVVNGVRDYGNKMGIPTVNGAILYHQGYIFNPLVFCGCLGILPHGSHPHQVEPGDLIVSLGGRTGRDGIHGATFSSGEMSLEINTQAGAAVQIGAPITEKKVSDVILQARDRQLYHAITDCGAGGFSSAIGEMGAKTGARVALDRAPLKYQGLAPWEIWLSEAQERMILAVPPANLNELLALCAIEEVEATVLGNFTNDHHLTLTYHNQPVANLDMNFLHNGTPTPTLQATWTPPTSNQIHLTVGTGLAPVRLGEPPTPTESPTLLENIQGSLSPTLLALLRHPNIASKEDTIRRYDHEVQGATILKPLVGRSRNGPSDAAVLQPYIEGTNSYTGIVISNGINPLYGKIDPYHMATTAIDEALRNLTAVGGDIRHAAILDNFCWGNPTDPEQLGLLVRAVKGCHDAAIGFGTPFISGKDSLNNEYRTNGQRIPVIPTLLISAVSVIDDASATIDMSLKTPGNLLYLIGQTRYEMASTYYGEVIDPDSFDQLFPHAGVPQVDLIKARPTMIALGNAIRQRLVRACHDLSEGGLLVAAAEMALAGQLGVNLDTTHITIKQAPTLHPNSEAIVRLFSETPSRFLVEITPEQFGTFEKLMRDADIRDVTYVGNITSSNRFTVRNGEEELINLGVDELQEAWKGGQP